MTLEDYTNYAKSFINKWYLKFETIIYCLLDCKVLYLILIKFSKEIFKEFGITLKFTTTTSSLSLKTLLTKFLKPEMEIPIITGDIYNLIQLSYTGGHVDVYNCHGFDLFLYVIISLYPSPMIKFMPCGNPIYFEGDIYSLL